MRRSRHEVSASRIRVGMNVSFRRYAACGQGKYLISLLTHLSDLPEPPIIIELSPPETNAVSPHDEAALLRKPRSEAVWEAFALPRAATTAAAHLLHNPYWTAPVPGLGHNLPVVVSIH